MKAEIMIQRLRDKFGTEALRSAVQLHTDYDKWQIEDLTIEELQGLYRRFFPQKTVTDVAVELANEKRLKELRSTVLKDASYIGLLEPDNWDRFNSWMLDLSPLKKPLKYYKIEEFQPLIRQFKSLRNKYEKQAKITGTKEWYHKHKLPIPLNN
ncbi:hypothetical protein [Riemerella columbipharyngis]|uniref:Uncharacterized protein n=1 Tax=Riemerella columbipharyngis TaxID=1071918 RepID=A0A1G7FHP3_9FLAO|nr:hypothetical protein [Riemerella columbipharyngis]SDE75372.1 hypothetical protein SAMN05421544_1233 [Riemerella columbipharyngis]